MKPITCGWRDFDKIRSMLAADGTRGTQSRLQRLLGCVSQSTIAGWKAADDLLKLIDGKYRLTDISTFSPTHATAMAVALRRKHGKDSSQWGEDVQEEALRWIERVEERQLTVPSLKVLLREECPEPPKSEDRFNMLRELDAVHKWLEKRRSSWPIDHQPHFFEIMRTQLENLEGLLDASQRLQSLPEDSSDLPSTEAIV